MDSDKVEKLLAAILLHQMKQESQSNKIFSLRSAGFTNYEIADLLGTTAGVVAQTMYASKKGKSKKKVKK
jgi:hypothetical protein